MAQFIDHSVLGSGVTPAEDDFRAGCDCPNEEACMYGECKCLDEVEGSDDEEEYAGEVDAEAEEIAQWYESERQKLDRAKQRGTRDGSGGTPSSTANGQRKKRFAYHSQGAKAGMLRGSYVNSRAPIYECHEGCRCSKILCPNRVVERGREVPLQIFRTKDGRGWGVKTMRELKRGQFVDRYLGEVITPQEADKRRHNASKAQRKDVYLFALDKFTDPESMDPRLVGAPLEVDGEFMSGPTRFINHSCEPNLRIFARVGDHADKHIHDLALFAIRDISKGEELTFDYVDGQEEIESNARDEKLQGEMTRCLCGSAKCRGYLW
ncbi:Histone-lysine N-methyltransferase, H3 lysine-9 specific dim-5 [Cytospora paraplurivora]|uniref:Histone-lysine N-methyltransferase, H3 lysine-9 specific dim-5 n=1 Tax=Cytospora paraplurivora TaxID=2898453 RepID=A0AAN9U933_9PEZI